MTRKMKREKRKVHRFKKKAGWTDYHHLVPKSLGGQSIGSNLLKIDAYRHDAIHLLFKNRSLHEIIEFLKRVEQAKESTRYQILFGN